MNKKKSYTLIVLFILVSYFMAFMFGSWTTRHSAELIEHNQNGYVIYYHNTNDTEFYK